ncbi:MAG: hypothetical protein LUG52_07225 [Clostridia bacterium]|nr:hypothetical protein [Clostridia bacterium]
MKKILSVITAFSCALAAAGCGKTQKPQDEAEIVTENDVIAEYIPTEVDISSEILAYIKDFDGYAAVLDEVELVSVPSDRAAELKIEDEDAPNGIYVHNSDLIEVRYDLADDCEIVILDWENSYEEKSIISEDFAELLRERGEEDALYKIEINNGKIVSITEIYMP